PTPQGPTHSPRRKPQPPRPARRFTTGARICLTVVCPIADNAGLSHSDKWEQWWEGMRHGDCPQDGRGAGQQGDGEEVGQGGRGGGRTTEQLTLCGGKEMAETNRDWVTRKLFEEYGLQFRTVWDLYLK